MLEIMKRTSLLATLAVLVACVCSCGVKDETAKQYSSVLSMSPVEGDSTVYGLACDGCNDTIVVLLRDLESDPDTFNVLNATRNHRVFGRLHIGDQVALTLDTDRTVARQVVCLTQLQGSWHYMAVPTLRKRADVSEQMRKEFLSNMPDSLRAVLLAPRKQGFTLSGDGSAMPIGMPMNSKEEGPAIYPPVKRYRQWHVFNGRLVLTETGHDSLGNRTVIGTDTASFVLLRRDSLVLRFTDGEQSYSH